MLGAVDDKILAPLAGRNAFLHSVEAFHKSGVTRHFVIVHRDAEQKKALALALAEAYDANSSTNITVEWVLGGKERQDSVFNGLLAVPLTIDYVFIHDCARPFVAPSMLAALASSVAKDKAVVLAHRVTDTIKEIPAEAKDTRRVHLRTLDRSRLWGMETPQVFERELITQAYRKLRTANTYVTDDAAAAELSGHPVTLMENHFPNPKLTTPADLAYLEFLFSRQNPS